MVMRTKTGHMPAPWGCGACSLGSSFQQSHWSWKAQVIVQEAKARTSLRRPGTGWRVCCAISAHVAGPHVGVCHAWQHGASTAWGRRAPVKGEV